MALVLMGEGEAEYRGSRMKGEEALRLAGIAPVELESKEGISLLNGTQAMLAVGCLELEQAEMLARAADVVTAMTLDGLKGTPRAFDARIHEIRPHPGQRASAAHLEELLEGSEIRESHIACRKVQDAYSLRCAPQVHGAVRDTLAEARRVFEIELNSVTDNPLVIGEEFSRAAAGVLARLSGDRDDGAGRDFRAAHRSVGESGVERRTAAVSCGARGVGIGIHDGAGDGGVAGGGKSSARDTGVAGDDHD